MVLTSLTASDSIRLVFCTLACDVHTFSKPFDPALALRLQVGGEIRREV
jgi:hypothetical protein